MVQSKTQAIGILIICSSAFEPYRCLMEMSDGEHPKGQYAFWSIAIFLNGSAHMAAILWTGKALMVAILWGYICIWSKIVPTMVYSSERCHKNGFKSSLAMLADEVLAGGKY